MHNPYFHFSGPIDDPDSFITNVCGYREYLMFQTTGPELNLEFTTDGQKTGKGFRITFETGRFSLQRLLSYFSQDCSFHNT